MHVLSLGRCPRTGTFWHTNTRADTCIRYTHRVTQPSYFLHIWLRADVFPLQTPIPNSSILGIEFLVYPRPVTSKPFASENATRKVRGLYLTRVGEGTLVAVCALRKYLS